MTVEAPAMQTRALRRRPARLETRRLSVRVPIAPRVVSPVLSTGRACRLAALAAVVLVLCQVAAADTIRKRSGTILRGRIISETDTYVIFEWTQFGACTVKVPRKDILTITKGTYDPKRPVDPEPKTPGKTDPGKDPPAPKGKVLRFCHIPINGEIGIDVTADDFEAVVRNVLLYRIDVLVLHFDTPGGSAAETEKILAKMGRLKGVRTIALVKRALSTGAVLAMACPEIYMVVNGRIGDVTRFKGEAEPEKGAFSSAQRAAFRTTVQVAKHSALLLKGMMDAEVQLAITTTGNKPTVLETAGEKVLGEKVIKAKGRTLALTGPEAVDCGLARAVVNGINDVTKTFDPTRLLFHAWKGGHTFMKNKVANNRLAFRQAKYLKSIAPQLAVLDKEYKALDDEARGIIAERNSLKRKYEDESNRIADEYRRSVRRAEERYVRDYPTPLMRESSPSLFARQAHDARRIRDARIDDAINDRDRAYRRVDGRYKDAFKTFDSRYRRLDNEARQVLAKKKKLLAAGPK